MIFVYVMVIIMIILNNIIQIFWQGLAADFLIIFLQIFQLMHSQKLYFFNWENWV